MKGRCLQLNFTEKENAPGARRAPGAGVAGSVSVSLSLGLSVLLALGRWHFRLSLLGGVSGWLRTPSLLLRDRVLIF